WRACLSSVGAVLSSHFFFSSRRRHTRSVSAFLLNRSSDLPSVSRMTNLTSKEAKMGKVMRHTLGASLNIRHNLSSSKGPKPLQRSEERRVGKERRCRRARYDKKRYKE